MKRLEDELNIPLLIRSPKGVELTYNALWLADLSESFLYEIKSRLASYQQYSQGISCPPSGNLDIYINPVGTGSSTLASFICNLSILTNDLNINLITLSRDILIKKIISGDISLGYICRTTYNGTYLDELSSGIYFEPLLCGELIVLANENLAISKFNTISIKKLYSYPICGYNEAYEDRLKEFFNKNFHVDIMYENIHVYQLYKEKIKSGEKIGLTMKFENEDETISDISGVKHINIKEDIKIYLGPVFSLQGGDDLKLNYFNDQLKQYLASHKKQ